MGHGNEVNHRTWECSNLMGYGNQVNDVTWEGGKLCNLERSTSWDIGMT